MVKPFSDRLAGDAALLGTPGCDSYLQIEVGAPGSALVELGSMSPVPARALVVSLHDVSPLTRPACERIVAELAGLGVAQTSLLVIPDHHRRGHFRDDAAFCAWLARSVADGHEIVTHGYHHLRARRPGESAMQKMATRIYTAGEGEFFDLDRATARELVTRGMADLHEAGFEPRGFIAPAWLLSADALDALRELDVEYTTTLGAVIDLKSNRTWDSQSLVWSVRSGWRRTASLGWNAMLFRRLQRNPLMRISIHPVDLQYAAIWEQIRALVARTLTDRKAMTYEAWIALQRASHPSPLNSELP